MARERPVFLPEFATYVEGLRKARKPKAWNQHEAAAQAARRQETAALTRQVLLRLERGQIKNPETEVLAAISKLFGVPYREIVERLVQDRFRIPMRADLVRQTSDLDSGLPQHGGVPDGSAAARIHDLEERLRQHEKTASEVHKVADQLFKIAVALEQDRQTGVQAPRRGRRHRKAG